MGKILDLVSWRIPSTYQALAQLSAFGVDAFQAHADYVKFRFFGTIEDAALETNYDPITADIISKLTTLRVIPAAIDYYGHQLQSIQIDTDTHRERKDYLEKRDYLWQLYRDLQLQVYEDFRGDEAPKISFGSGDKITPDPHDFFLPFTEDLTFETGRAVGGTVAP